MARTTCHQTPERVPSASPARRPATERSWHGKPTANRQTGLTSAQFTVVMSPMFATPGQWRLKTWAAAGSTSACQATVPP